MQMQDDALTKRSFQSELSCAESPESPDDKLQQIKHKRLSAVPSIGASPSSNLQMTLLHEWGACARPWTQPGSLPASNNN